MLTSSTLRTAPVAALLSLLALLASPALADDGHDHGAAPAPAGGPALPRFAATSELFELVGVVDGTRLTVFLDRFEDNAPVPGAKVDLEVGGARIALKEHTAGEFEGELAQALAPGVTPVTATVVAGPETDLLAGEFDVHAEAHPAREAGTPLRTTAWVAASAAAVAVVAGLAWAARRRQGARAVGGAA